LYAHNPRLSPSRPGRSYTRNRGDAGTLRLVYTLVSAFETVPLLLDRLDKEFPLLKVEAARSSAGTWRRFSWKAAATSHSPRSRRIPTRYVSGRFGARVVRGAVADGHRLAGKTQVELAGLRNETLELWPHEMAPGYYDAMVAACRAPGFHPKIDSHGAGSTVWGYIAKAAESASSSAP
jgi:hypothetical protein